MSSYGFIKELIEKEHTPTPAYVFDLDKMKEFVKKVQSCLGETREPYRAVADASFKSFSYRTHDECGSDI